MSWIDTLKKAARSSGGKDLSPAEQEAAARDLVQMSALGASAVALAPLPFVDFVAITPIQAAMVMAVGRVYGRELNLEEGRAVLVELAGVCGAGLVARQIFTTASKLLLPGLGGVLSAPYAFAVTWAMGQTAMRYFEDFEGTRGKLKQIFEDALGEGKRLFSKEAVDEFRRKRGQEVETFAREQAEAEQQAGEGGEPKQAAPKKTTKPKPGGPVKRTKREEGSGKR